MTLTGEPVKFSTVTARKRGLRDTYSSDPWVQRRRRLVATSTPPLAVGLERRLDDAHC